MSGQEKENVPLRPTSTNFTTAQPPAVSKANKAPGGNKSTLAVKKDFAIDLHDAEIPVTKEVVEAMRKRILELEEQLNGQSSAKRRKVSKDAEEQPTAGPSNSTKTSTTKEEKKADPKKVDAILKKIWSSLQREIKTEKYKFKGGPPKVCRIEEIIEEDEWMEIFFKRVEQIRAVQPLPENKPNSSVWITQYPGDDVEKIFGKHFKELKGNRYSLGGICARYAKGEKIGLVAIQINGLQVNYSMNTMKCGMKFEVEEENLYRCGLDHEGDPVDILLYNAWRNSK